MINIFLIWNVPGGQSKMCKYTMFILPHRLNFCPGFCGTPSRPRKEVFQAFRQSKSRAVAYIHLGKGAKETILADFVESLYFCKGLTDHLLKKGKSTFVHALMQGFRRHLQLIAQLR